MLAITKIIAIAFGHFLKGENTPKARGSDLGCSLSLFILPNNQSSHCSAPRGVMGPIDAILIIRHAVHFDGIHPSARATHRFVE